jgi:hypothetical protein
MADEDVPIVAADDEQLAKRRDALAPPPIDLAERETGQAIALPAVQGGRPAIPTAVKSNGQPFTIGRHAGIPGYQNPPTTDMPIGDVVPPHAIGVAQLASKAENIHNPLLRGLAKVGAGIARAGDIAGTILAPGVAAAIPGTTMNQAVKIGGQRKQEAQQVKEGLEKAQTHEAEATADERENAQPKTPEAKEQAFASLLQPGQVNPATQKPYTLMEAFQAVSQVGQDVKPTPRAEQPVTADEANTINAERAQQWHVLHPQAELPPSYMSKAGDTRDVVKEADERFGRLGGAEGTAATREATAEARKQAEADRAAARGEAAASRGEAAANRKESKDTALKEKVLTYWQPTLDSAERVNVMAKNYREGVDNHNQQAMLSLLANHLGMTMGLQKGARMNKDIIQEAQKSQPWLEGMKAKFDKDGYLAGVTLGPEQMKQMLDLGFERYREDVKKSRSMAGYIGVTDEPPRHISKDAARYYREAAGDQKSAEKMATEDGWTF